MTRATKIWHEFGGAKEGSLLVFIHGLGANATVWNALKPFVEANWSGGWMTMDLAGHGRSKPKACYSVGDYAADIAALIPADRPVALVGHSLGGAVGLALASGLYGVSLRSLTATGIKTQWTDADYERGKMLAAQAPKLFTDRAAALERALKVAGLFGLVDPASADAEVGILKIDGGFQLATDPKTNAVTPLDFKGLTALAKVPTHLLCGDRDPVASVAGMESLGFAVTPIKDAGHNPQIEDPEKFWQLIYARL